MAADTVHIRLYYEGEFGRTAYTGGDRMLVPNVSVDEFSYRVLMEFIKDYLHFLEIGGVYISKGIQGGWKLVKDDNDVLGHVFNCIADDEVEFYIDNVVDKEVEPLPQMQPHVTVRPRKKTVQVSTKISQKRQFVTTHQLQQHQNKFKRKSPHYCPNKKTATSPGMKTKNTEETRKVTGSARRKLDLQKDLGDDEDSEGNSISDEELPPQPTVPVPVPVSDYEQVRIARMNENQKRMEELGVKKLAAVMKPCASNKRKGKDKVQEGGDDYNPEDESEDTSVETTEDKRSKKAKKNASAPGPRTRSRRNATVVIGDGLTSAADENDNEPIRTTTTVEKEAPEKDVTSSLRVNRIRPTCSKKLKQSTEFEAAGSLSAYLALRERQKQGLPDIIEHDVPEANKEDIGDETSGAEAAPRKPRERSKLEKIHGRTADRRPVITLNERGQPVSSDGKVVAELSRFLGTVVKDNVSLTHINWRVVPDQLKNKMWEYTRERYIIPDEGKKWVNTTLNDSWRVYKSRVKKKYYSRFESDKERLENKPEDIPLEDFKQLLNYWADEEVQSIAEDNAARRNSFTETHTLGPQSLAQVRDKLKKKDPNQGEPSDAQVYLETRERKTGRDYKTTKIVDKRIKRIKRMMNQGRDPNLVVQRGKSKGRGWLLGRNGSRPGTSSSTADPTTQDPYVLELTNQIRQNLETELEDKVNRKVQENMAMLLKKLGEANPGMNLDVGNFCATISSEADGNGTPITDGATS